MVVIVPFLQARRGRHASLYLTRLGSPAPQSPRDPHAAPLLDIRRRLDALRRWRVRQASVARSNALLSACLLRHGAPARHQAIVCAGSFVTRNIYDMHPAPRAVKRGRLSWPPPKKPGPKSKRASRCARMQPRRLKPSTPSLSAAPGRKRNITKNSSKPPNRLCGRLSRASFTCGEAVSGLAPSGQTSPGRTRLCSAGERPNGKRGRRRSRGEPPPPEITT
jgi:hypothetical protein